MSSTAPVITLDGPGGSGKGTLAALVARQLGWNLLDSGALYRLLAFAARNHGVDYTNEESLKLLAAHLDVQFLAGHDAIVAFLRAKWERERDYRLIKELWAHQDSRIAVRFAYEWHDAHGRWFRSYGNENWDFAEDGRMRRRIASINDLAIVHDARLFRWPLGVRPADHPGLSELGL